MLFNDTYFKKQKFIEQLLHKYKNTILNSKYQNCNYNGVPLWKFFGVETKSNKPAPKFNTLISLLIKKTFLNFNYDSLIKYKEILKSYPEIYIRYGNNDDYIKVKDILAYFDYSIDDYMIEYYKPSFFSRCYKIKWKNKKELEYTTQFNINIQNFRKMFKNEKDIMQEDIDFSIFDKIKKECKSCNQI